MNGDKPLSSEAKLTIGASGVGLIAMLFDLLKEGQASKLSDPVLIALMVCVTLVVISYNISRGLAKYEYRGLPPNTQPPADHQPPTSPK